MIMKLSKLFTEQERKQILEYTVKSFSMKDATTGYPYYGYPVVTTGYPYSPLSATDLHRLLPKSAGTSKDAIKRLKAAENQQLSAHSQVTYVRTKGTDGENVQELRFQEIQYYSGPLSNSVSLIFVSDCTGLDANSKPDRIGYAIVDTKVFNRELASSYTLISSHS